MEKPQPETEAIVANRTNAIHSTAAVIPVADTINNELSSPHSQNDQVIEMVSESGDSGLKVDSGFTLKRKNIDPNAISKSANDGDVGSNKKIKTRNDYESSRNGFETDEKSCSDSAANTKDQTTDNPNEMNNYLKIQGKGVIQTIILDYSLKNDIILNDFSNLKKRSDVIGIVKEIQIWCSQFHLPFIGTFEKILISELASLGISYNLDDINTHTAGTPVAPESSSITTKSSSAISPFKDSVQGDTKTVSISSPLLELTPAASPVPVPLVGSTVGSNKEDKTDKTNKTLSISASLEETSTIGTREQIVERAKQEAFVMQKVALLRKNGMWSNKRLPKVQEPLRIKTHWDYLLEEMQWLAVDFAQERKWKRNSAKKCARLALKFHNFKECQAERSKKEEQIKLKRIASNMAKMVKQFWSEIEKVLEAKQEVQLNEKRKKIHDMQLRFIVDKADHLTEKLAQELIPQKASKASSTCSDQESSVSHADQLDQEFEKGSMCSDDDEETIAKEEKDCQQVDYTDEINALAKESEMPIEDLLAMYGIDDLDQTQKDNEQDDTSAEESTENDNETGSESIEDEEMENADEESDFSDVEQMDTNELESSFISKVGNDNKKTDNEKANDELNTIAAGAESLQPKGNTFSSVQVITKVPSLLKYQLREYQHIGLDWLVAMHEKNLNGILADEMGLGKTIQTIALIAHLACEKKIWGPHLIVVPTSVMLNWEMEFKKWCPALKILTYFGNPKERRLKRKGWTKPDTFHVCITSYKLVIQDHQSFRRQKWVYLILDEAHNIKNFKSQRWQMLLNFNSTHRLLLTGTPLQNNLMELWSLMHFLMPNVFQSHREFKDWFDKPMTGMIEGQNEYNENLIRRLHKVLRPFLLRRLKCDVEKQLPKKYEHVLRCPLSKRQRFLYDEFMSLGDTKETLASGNFLSVINILMQLRKVCNHPNLFEPRPTVSPFIDTGICYEIPGLVTTVQDYDPLEHICFLTHHLLFTHTFLDSYCQIKTRPNFYDASGMKSIIDNCEDQIYVRLTDYKDFHRYMSGIKMINSNNNSPNNSKPSLFIHRPIPTKLVSSNNQIKIINNSCNKFDSRKPLSMSFNNKNTTVSSATSYIYLNPRNSENKPNFNAEDVKIDIIKSDDKSDREKTVGYGKFAREENLAKTKTFFNEKLDRLSRYNHLRSQSDSIICLDLLEFLNLNHYKVDFSSKNPNKDFSLFVNGLTNTCQSRRSKVQFHPKISPNSTSFLENLLYTPTALMDELCEMLKHFIFSVPTVLSSSVKLDVSHQKSYKNIDQSNLIKSIEKEFPPQTFDVLTIPKVQMCLQLPETRLIQYDCGKLQMLDGVLWKLKAGKHRVLIFTQMSRMLDILEQFLNYHGHTYLRLDGTTKIDQRQALMERFNADHRIFCFILSTRSGGIGVNLTGADTVIFYDSDWNPTMDAQAQDRCHRIGQTRDVHIYRLISEKTVEENILKKARQKKMLGDVAIEEGNFTTAFFKQTAIKELFDVDETNDVNDETILVDSNSEPPVAAAVAFEQALCTAEEENDVTAAKILHAEVAAELDEFDETIPIEEVPDEKSLEEEQIEGIISQLTPLERYALKFIESSQDFHELKQAEEEMEETKKQYQKSINEWKKNQDETNKQIFEEFNESIMTVSREDEAIAKVLMSLNSSEPMPIWAPPTPPHDENDHYIDFTLGFSYEKVLMPESQLPPVYMPKEPKRVKVDNGRKPVYSNLPVTNSINSTPHIKLTKRVDDLFNIAKSPFDRSNSIIGRYRREILLNKSKVWPGCQNYISVTNKTLLSQHYSTGIPPSSLASSTALSRSQQNFNLSLFPKWSIKEDLSIVLTLLYIQELPYNLCTIYPAHTPNWDFVTDQVNFSNFYKRSAKSCKYHFESIMSVKEDQRPSTLTEGTMPDGLPKIPGSYKQTKSKKAAKNQAPMNQMPQLQPAISFPPGSPFPLLSSPLNQSTANHPNLSGKAQANQNNLQTSLTQLTQLKVVIEGGVNDANKQFTQELMKRFGILKTIVIQKTQTSKSLFKKQPNSKKYDMNQIFSQFQINFDQPSTVQEIAAMRAERINREKQAHREARDSQQRDPQAMEFNQGIKTQPIRSYTPVPPSSVHCQHGPVNIRVPHTAAANHSAAHTQQPPSPQIILNHGNVPNSNNFVPSAQHMQHLLASKVVAAKLQNLTPVSGDGTISDSNLVHSNISAKVFSGHVSNSPSNSQNIHHVSLTQAQSMGLISQSVTSIAALPQSSSEQAAPSGVAVSTLTHFHQPSQTSQQQQQQPQAQPQPQPQPQQQQPQNPPQQFMIQQTHGNNPGVNVSLGQKQFQFALTPSATRQLFLRQTNRPLLPHHSLQTPNIQLTQPRHIHMQSVRCQGNVTSSSTNPVSRIQMVSASNQIAHANKITTLIPSSTNSSNSQSTNTLIGPPCILTSTSGHVITPVTNKGGNGNQSFIARIRKENVPVASLKQNPLTTNQSMSSTNLMATSCSPSSQVFHVQQPQQPNQSSLSNEISSLSGNIVKTISANVSTLQPSGGGTHFANISAYTLPPAKVVAQSPVQAPIRFVKPKTTIQTQGVAGSMSQTSTPKVVQQTLVNTDQQQQATRSANIITPMFSASNPQTGPKASTFHLVSTSNGSLSAQPLLQPSAIPVNKPLQLSNPGVSLQQGHGPAKGNTITVQPISQSIAAPSSGQSSSSSNQGGSVNPIPSSSNNAAQQQQQQQPSSANFILAPQSHIPSSIKAGNSSSQQHFIAVSSNDSSVNATTIKLLPTSAGTIAIQQSQPPQQPQQHQPSSGNSGLSQNITTTPKGHIILSGHNASIVGQSGPSTTSSLTTISASSLLQQVVNNQSSNPNQTLTFAIRTAAHGQSIGQSQSNTVHLSTLTLKNPSSSGVSLQQASTPSTASATNHPTSALVAALSQPSSDQQGSTTVTASSALLRSLASSNVSAKAIPIVLMQSSQNPNLITQTSTGAVSLINIGNTVSNNNQPRPVVSNKITTATQTSGATLGSILSAAAKASGSSDSQYTTNQATTTSSSKPNESPLIEALMTSLKQSNVTQKEALPPESESKQE